MKRYLIIAVAIFFLCPLLPSNAQSIDTPIDGPNGAPRHDFKDRLFFGGIMGLQFATGQTFVEVAPMIGYKFTNRLSGGLNLKYLYYKYSLDKYNTYSTNIYGGGPFARFFIYEGLFAHFEYEILNMDVPDLYGGYKRDNITSVFVGGGYRQMMGERSAVDIMLLYNINESMYSPYSNPILQFGFAFGI